MRRKLQHVTWKNVSEKKNCEKDLSLGETLSDQPPSAAQQFAAAHSAAPASAGCSTAAEEDPSASAAVGNGGAAAELEAIVRESLDARARFETCSSVATSGWFKVTGCPRRSLEGI